MSAALPMSGHGRSWRAIHSTVCPTAHDESIASSLSGGLTCRGTPPPLIPCGKHLTRSPVRLGQRNDMPNSVIIIVGLVVLATLFLASLLAKMFRKAGPNEAIIVYGFRGP